MAGKNSKDKADDTTPPQAGGPDQPPAVVGNKPNPKIVEALYGKLAESPVLLEALNKVIGGGKINTEERDALMAALNLTPEQLAKMGGYVIEDAPEAEVESGSINEGEEEAAHEEAAHEAEAAEAPTNGVGKPVRAPLLNLINEVISRQYVALRENFPKGILLITMLDGSKNPEEAFTVVPAQIVQRTKGKGKEKGEPEFAIADELGATGDVRLAGAIYEHVFGGVVSRVQGIDTGTDTEKAEAEEEDGEGDEANA